MRIDFIIYGKLGLFFFFCVKESCHAKFTCKYTDEERDSEIELI